MASDYSANGHFEYGVFFRGGAIPWVATLTKDDANVIVDAMRRAFAEEYEVRALDDLVDAYGPRHYKTGVYDVC